VALVKAGKAPDVSVAKAQANYKKAVEKGLLKILSKMGISLLSCYHGAQIFEAYGLGEDVVEAAFRGSVSRVGGMTLADLSREAAAFWATGFPAADGAPPPTKLEDYGFIQSRPKGEHHVNNQAMAKLLHKAIGAFVFSLLSLFGGSFFFPRTFSRRGGNLFFISLSFSLARTLQFSD
jgi:glutamate synthase (ferredoxin)